jgi:hypothetical protein
LDDPDFPFFPSLLLLELLLLLLPEDDDEDEELSIDISSKPTIALVLLQNPKYDDPTTEKCDVSLHNTRTKEQWSGLAVVAAVPVQRSVFGNDYDDDGRNADVKKNIFYWIFSLLDEMVICG